MPSLLRIGMPRKTVAELLADVLVHDRVDELIDLAKVNLLH